jgi:hypothetical protein
MAPRAEDDAVIAPFQSQRSLSPTHARAYQAFTTD